MYMILLLSFKKVLKVRLNFSHLFESQTPKRDVESKELLMSRDFTTKTPGGDFDWLIV